MSTQLVEKINPDITEKLEINQWHNTDTVLKWFNNITDKSTCSFTQFDIKEFYSSITENILLQTLKFAKQHTNMNKNDLRIINHYCKSLLYFDNKPWRKKTTGRWFDVIMDGFDEAEIWEPVGLCIQSKTRKDTSKIKFGL